MKTLKIGLLALGFFCINAAFSYTAINLPLNKMKTIKAGNVLINDQSVKSVDIAVSDNTNLVKNLLVDTILIDLSQDKMSGPFPSASKDCILKQVPYPEFAREKGIEGGVAVRFMFDDSGAIHVLEACSNAPELEQYVKNKLSSLQLKNCVADLNRDYYLRFMFRLF